MLKMEAVAFKPQVPYNEKNNTYIEQEKEFYQSWMEFSLKKREQVHFFQSANGATNLIYQVPRGYTLFITHINLDFTSNASTGTALIYTGTTISQPLISMANYVAFTQTRYASHSYSCPLKINSEENIYILSTGVGIWGSAVIVGFLEPNPSS